MPRCLLFLALAAFVAAQSAGSRSVWDGVYTAGQARRGEAAYRSACSRCHGDDLSGDDEAPPLAGRMFVYNWNGTTVGDLFDLIRFSMPADRPGTLSREQSADILAFLLRENRFPAGATELEARTEPLKQIRFEAERPSR